MRIIITLCAALFLSPTQVLSRECIRSSQDVLIVEHWSASITDVSFSEFVSIEIEIKNISGKNLRMIDGVMFFDDLLGRSIVNIPVESDPRVNRDKTFFQSGLYSTFSREILRLTSVNPSDIIVTTCVKSLITSESDVIRYDQ